MQHDAGVGQRPALAGLAGGQQQARHRRRLAHADGADRVPQVLRAATRFKAGEALRPLSWWVAIAIFHASHNNTCEGMWMICRACGADRGMCIYRDASLAKLLLATPNSEGIACWLGTPAWCRRWQALQ